MLLRNLHSLHGEATDICIQADTIAGVGTNLSGERKTISFEDAIVFPGLINSHDHLDFNLYPQLGGPMYNSYTEWGRDIHERHSETIRNVLKIPLHLRTQWGLYKNLLNGITTVVNHGEVLAPGDDIITVFENCRTIHSVRFEKRWKLKLLSPKRQHMPIVIHVGEGTDEDSTREIDELIRWNWLRRQLVGVHGVGMTETQARHFRGLVWCPASNYFMLGRTADINKMKSVTNIVFGTDSTLSAEWNLWNHLRMARETEHASDEELLNMLTINAATLWQLPRLGKIEKGYVADIVIARKKEDSYYNSLFQLEPEDILMVTCRGRVKLFDSSLYQQMRELNVALETFDAVHLGTSRKYVFGNVQEVIRETKTYYPCLKLPVTLTNS